MYILFYVKKFFILYGFDTKVIHELIRICTTCIRYILCHFFHYTNFKSLGELRGFEPTPQSSVLTYKYYSSLCGFFLFLLGLEMFDLPNLFLFRFRVEELDLLNIMTSPTCFLFHRFQSEFLSDTMYLSDNCRVFSL